MRKYIKSSVFVSMRRLMSKVTLNGGISMPSWYDIYSLDESNPKEDEKGIRKSSEKGIA